MKADDAGETELARQEAKRYRESARRAHPFARDQPCPPEQGLFDDQRDCPTALVAFAGAADKLGVPAVDFFDALDGLPLRRLYVRRLVLADDSDHELGRDTDEVVAALRSLLRPHRVVLFTGTSLGAYHALLLGTLLDVDRILAVQPVTTVRPEQREALGDRRPGPGHEPASEEYFQRFGDLLDVWKHRQPREVHLHYPLLSPAYTRYAERVVHLPFVHPTAHEVRSTMAALVASGGLRREVSDVMETTPGSRW